jgi:hypothetical protein
MGGAMGTPRHYSVPLFGACLVPVRSVLGCGIMHKDEWGNYVDVVVNVVFILRYAFRCKLVQLHLQRTLNPLGLSRIAV